VVVTYKLRTKQSADAFLQGLGGYHGTVRVSRLPDSLDAVLRFYDLSPAYLKYKKGDVVKKGMDSVDRDVRTAAVAAAVSERIFTPGYLKGRTAAEALTFSDDLYDLFSVQFSMPGEIRERGWSADSVDLSPAFSREDLVWDDFRNGAQDFLEKGPARDPLGIQVKVAAPLLVDFVRTTDEFIAGKAKDAVLRFTHAEAISPFASLLGIPEASVAAPGIARYHDHWRAERVIPLSANVQWIIYRNGEEVRVKLLLNEREVELPIGGGPYYPWKELRGYCIERLKAVQAGMQGDMVAWLKELK